MKVTLILLSLMVAFWACSDNSTGSDNDNNNQVDIETFQSVNVKTEGMHYFTFNTNTGVLTEPDAWDLAFAVIQFPVEIAPCQYLTIPDPAILAGDGIEIARIDASSLDDVVEVPATNMFAQDIKEGSPYIGSDWYDESFNVNPDVYVIRTCGGGVGVIDIKRYDYDFMNHQITNVVFEYKYNSDGSMDFTSTTIDSFATGNANEEVKYFSFDNGAVTADDTYDIKVNGTSFWLGQNVMIKKMSNMDLGAVSNVADDNWDTDVTPTYITINWYDYGEGHILTPSDYVYVVKTLSNEYAAFEITNYYDNEGNSGVFTINWKYLEN